jgi:glycosyltransferase involved in cell wall biosynthesis
VNAIVITPFAPSSDSGRGLRTVGIIRALAHLGDVEVAYVPFGGEPDRSLAEEGVSLRPIRSSRGGSRLVGYLKASLSGIPAGFARGVSPELLAAVKRAAEGTFDLAIADGPTAGAAMLLAHASSLVYSAHNLESALRAQLHSSSRQQVALRRFERRLLESARETWLPSRRDVDGATGLAPEARLRLVPNVVDVAAIVPVVPAGTQRALFVADYRYLPNRNAVRFLVDEVMPRVWTRLPQARLALVGRNLDPPAGIDSRVEVRGFVERLADVYVASDCAVVPLQESGGSPLKLIEAMAYGLPVIATPLAASGVDGARPGIHYLEADSPKAIADGIVTALTQRTGEMTLRARALVESTYSIESLARSLAGSR